MANKKTLVLGASTNPDRYSYKATLSLLNKGYEVALVGIKKGQIAGIDISNIPPQYEEIDTVTLYLSPDNQKPYYDYIFSLRPKRIIFNPGTENYELIRLAKDKKIEVEIGCTLVMLSIGTY